MAGLKINLKKIQQIPLSVLFVDKYMIKANPTYVKVYIYALRLSFDSSKSFSLDAIAESLDILVSDVINALIYWDSQGVVKFSQNGDDYVLEFVDFSEEKKTEPKETPFKKPTYTSREIDTTIKSNAELKQMYKVAESILGKPLSPSEVKTLYGFYDYLSLPADVILVIVEYCTSMEKTSVRYMEKVAINWSESGITNFDAAQAHLNALKEQNEIIGNIKKILQISGRKFTDSEMKYINDWLNNLKATPEQIKEAYDVTILNTSKLSYQYMNKVLISIVNGTKPETKEPVRKVRTNFNNFSSGRKMTDREKDLLQRQMEVLSKKAD